MSLNRPGLKLLPSFTQHRGRYKFGRLEMDVRSTEVTLDGHLVHLSRKEFQLLQYFMEHAGETLSREELLRNVWDCNTVLFIRTVDVHVVWLREKIESDPKNPQLVVTINGFGYKFSG